MKIRIPMNPTRRLFHVSGLSAVLLITVIMTACSQADALRDRLVINVFYVTGAEYRSHYIERDNQDTRYTRVTLGEVPGYLHSVVTDGEFLYLLTRQDFRNGPDRVGLHTLRLPGLDEPKLVVPYERVRLADFAFLTIHSSGVYSMSPTGPVRLLDHNGDVDIVYFTATDENGNHPSYNKLTRIGIVDGYALVPSSVDRRLICVDLSNNTMTLGPALPFVPIAIYHSNGNDVLCRDRSGNLHVVRVHIVKDAAGSVDVRADVTRSIPVAESYAYAYVIDGGEIWIVQNDEVTLTTTFSSMDDRGRAFTVHGGYFRDGVVSTRPIYSPAR